MSDYKEGVLLGLFAGFVLSSMIVVISISLAFSSLIPLSLALFMVMLKILMIKF